jgi:hypothetical protein
MLVTFRTEAYADITMFGDVAVQLLRLMGHSGSVPGAILTEDIAPALERLKGAVEVDKRTSTAAQASGKAGDVQGADEAVSLAHRALPLIELLAAAQREHATVMWDEQ